MGVSIIYYYVIIITINHYSCCGSTIYYTSKSAAEHGTLYHAINRTNVVKKPLDSFNTCEDFFVLVVEGRIIVAILTMVEMKLLDNIPSAQYAEEGADTWMLQSQ